MKQFFLVFIISLSFFTVMNGCTGNSDAKETENNENQENVTDNKQGGSLDANNETTNKESETGGKVHVLTTKDFKEKIYDYSTNQEWTFLGDKPVVVDFYADWCKPCKMIAPIMEELAGEYGNNVIFYKVNVDNEQELSSVFGINSIPSILFVPGDGSQPQIATGAMAKEDYVKAITEILKVNL